MRGANISSKGEEIFFAATRICRKISLEVHFLYFQEILFLNNLRVMDLKMLLIISLAFEIGIVKPPSVESPM